MNLSNNWIRVLTAIIIVMPSLIQAQNVSITLSEAVESYKENSLERALVRLEQDRKIGEAISYKAFPNPELSLFHENLNAGSPNYDETTIQISQPLEILGQPFLRNKSASALNRAAESEFQFKERQLIGELKSLYVYYWFLSERLRVVEDALSVVDGARKSAIARKEEGAFSGMQIQRFNIEYSKYQKLYDKIRSDLNLSRNKLLLLIFPDLDENSSVEFVEDFGIKILSETKDSFVEHALQNRSDLQQLESLIEASELQYRVEKKERFPDLNIDLGYKNQSNGSEGFVIGGSIKLPVFNQNKGKIHTARSEHRMQTSTLALAKRSLKNEVYNAYEEVVFLGNQWDTVQDFSSNKSILETAKIAYQESKYSLLELLDATEAYVTGQTLFYQTIKEYNQALFELDVVSGGKLFSNN
jgi:outer membrane protein TolC